MLKRALFLVLFFSPLVSAGAAWAYVPSGLYWPDETFPVPYHINARGSDDLAFERLEALFAQAFSAWTEVPCTRLEIGYQGTTTVEPGIDEMHVMAFIEEGWTLGSMTLGANSANVLSFEPYMLSADISFNGETITWKEGGGGRDLQTIDPLSVFTHEIGHFLGLSHTTHDGSATMAAAYLPDLSQQSLSHDDKVGICHIYPDPEGVGECVLEEEGCPAGASCGVLEEWAFCIEERDGLEAPCSVNHINCQDMCVYTSFDLEQGFCTRLCAEDSQCAPEGTCESFGQVKVCRLSEAPPLDQMEQPDELESESLEPEDRVEAEEDLEQEAEVESKAEVAEEEEIDLSNDDLESLPVEGSSGDEGCGCQIREGGALSAGCSFILFLGFIFFGVRRSRG